MPDALAAARAELAAAERHYRSFDRPRRQGETPKKFTAAYRKARDRHDAALKVLADMPDAPEVSRNASGSLVSQ